jgi:uncharacterized protein (TIGR02996 family)
MGTHQHPEAAAFEAGLLDHPHDLARWSAYSDYLTERGDPRGEFMRIQLALEDESLSGEDRKKLKAAEAELLAAHEREWLGPLAAFTLDGEKEDRWRNGARVMSPPVIHEFERGWLRKVEYDRLTVNQARALVACTESRMLRKLVVGSTAYDDEFTPGPDVPDDADEDEVALHALCRCPHLGAVRKFVLGDPRDSCRVPGELAYHLLKQMPRIEEIGLYARRVETAKLFALPMHALRSLTVNHITDYPLDRLASNPALAHLETLSCHPHAMEPGDEENGAYIRLEHLRAICRSPHLKKLSHLTLRLTDFGDAGVRELIDSAMFGRLRILDLQAGCISDEGAKLLAASPHLAKLELLNLNSNALTAQGVRLIEATGVNAVLTEQHTDSSFDPNNSGETPEYLFQGDWE